MRDFASLGGTNNNCAGGRTPWGSLLTCEENYGDGGGGNNIVGLNSDGQLFRVAENAINGSEFCGGCFSHDGRFMFANIQSPGLTLVIEGPWRKGQR